MMAIEGLTIEGEPSKGVVLYRTDLEGNPHSIYAECDSFAQAREHLKRRTDIKFKIRVPGRKFLDPREFTAWAQANFWECAFCGQEVELRDRQPRWPQTTYENCKLKDHYVGNECIAYRQPDEARKLMASA